MKIKTIQEKAPPLISPLFQYEDDAENVNIIFKLNKKTNVSEMQYISIDLLLKKIALENFAEKNLLLFNGFIQQYTSFISTEILVDKIFNSFELFRYLCENNINMSMTQEEHFKAGNNI
jgi:hypothetical protein